ncbi:hypothetical protein SAZ10_31745 [Mesorhizobium sp. BAC0120]|nr:hypothetical protein [Mesorhizobium sp. BAC0120]MDW6026343.1 hypothetical protein [Mesorhizobium sp. BAC0120]
MPLYVFDYALDLSENRFAFFGPMLQDADERLAGHSNGWSAAVGPPN